MTLTLPGDHFHRPFSYRLEGIKSTITKSFRHVACVSEENTLSQTRHLISWEWTDFRREVFKRKFSLWLIYIFST